MGPNLSVLSKERPKEVGKLRTISDRLKEAARSTFVGREHELSMLSNAIKADNPPFIVAFVHGSGGIGKSSLIQATLNSIGHEISGHVMDCREIEPTPQGFQGALGVALGMQESEPELGAVIHRLGSMGQRVVLALDTYETFGLMDTWLRQVFLPNLTENVFTIFTSRQPPNPAWLTSPGWQGLFKEIELRELSTDEAINMLKSRCLTPRQIERIMRFAKGYPLALALAASAILTQPNLEISEGPHPKILQQLTRIFLGGLPSETIRAVEATATVRRVTEPLLKALLEISDSREVFDRLQTQPFIDVTAEGLVFQDVVRETIANGHGHIFPWHPKRWSAVICGMPPQTCCT